MFAAWAPDGSVGLVSGYRMHGGAGRRPLVLGGARPARRAAAARRRVGRARPGADPLLVKAPRPVGRAHLRRADGAVDGRQRDATPPPSTIPTTRSGGPTALPSAVAFDLEWYATAPPVTLPAGDGYEQDGVVHGDRRAGRRAAAPDGGAGAPLAPLGAARSAPLVAAGRLRPHRAAGAVRLPRRHRRRLGAHPGRLAGSRLPRRLADRRRRRRTSERRRTSWRTAQRPARRARAAASDERGDGRERRARSRTAPPTNAPHPAASGVDDAGGRRRRAASRPATPSTSTRERRHRDTVLELPAASPGAARGRSRGGSARPRGARCCRCRSASA